MKLFESIAERLKTEFNRIQGQLSSGCSVPIGGIVFFHISLSGVPTLPTNFVGCNGQVLSDSASPLNGRTMPNLNNTEVYVRGGLTSGVTSSTNLRTGVNWMMNKISFYYVIRVK